MPRGKKAKQPAAQSEEVKKEEEPTSEDVKEEYPKTEQEEPKTEQEGSSGDVKKEEKAGCRIRIGSGFSRVSGSGSVFGIRIRIQEGKNDPQKQKKN
jgi:hypothetical protein